jgi:membrane-bound lytic murein transglycosylase D
VPIPTRPPTFSLVTTAIAFAWSVASGTALAAVAGAASAAPDAPQFVIPVPAPPGRSGALAPTPDSGPSVAVAPIHVAPGGPSPAPAVPTPAPDSEDAAEPEPQIAQPASPPVPAAVDVHRAPGQKMEVQVDRGRDGSSEQVELDLPDLEAEKARIKSALPPETPEVADAEPEFDIPIVVNRKVERWLEYYQTAGRKHMALWLARSERYIPMMQTILKERGLPSDLVYLALIESGFSTSARSHAAAVGPWQFIAGTGRRYGLRTDWWIDERQCPEKSTVAAAEYLSDLHDMFGSWYLAAAGYNAGEGRIVKGIARFDLVSMEVDDPEDDPFWRLSERRFLAAETKEYVPKLIAAALIAKSPEKYGFGGIAYHEPLVYDKVPVPDATDLQLVAWAAETSYAEIKRLNPELKRWATPPNYPGYQVKIPAGTREVFLRNFGTIAPSKRITYRRHVVRSGETLSRVAATYGVEMAQVQRMNQLRGNLIRAGQSLVVPVPAHRGYIARGDDAEETRRVNPGKRTLTASRRTPAKVGRPAAAPQPAKTIRYTVRRGDTIWGIAERHDVTVAEVKKWNGLSSKDVLKAGDRITIKAPAES